MSNVKRSILVMLVVLFGAGCNDTMPTNCVIKEAIERYGTATSSKEMYTYDGSNYIGSEYYLYDANKNKFNDMPSAVRTYTYDDEGRIVTARHTAVGGNSYEQDEYTYADGHVTYVTVHHTLSNSGTIMIDNTYEFHYIPSPKDSIYQFDGYVEEYKNGNLVRMEGADYRSIYVYDNHNNAARQYPFRRMMYALNFGYCRNNLIEEHHTPATYSRKYSYAFFGDGQLNQSSNLDIGRTVSFVYNCE